MTRIKICGLTREADVQQATTFGAWACGFVLTDAPQRVSAERARELSRLARRCLTVGVFSTESAEQIAAAMDEASLLCAQLGAGPAGPSVAAVRAAAQELGIRPRIIATADAPDAAEADFVLARNTEGTEDDWSTAAAVEGASYRLVVGGDLTAATVGAAISQTKPLAVDVSSSVESTPGEKDQALLTAFFNAVADADRELRSGATG